MHRIDGLDRIGLVGWFYWNVLDWAGSFEFDAYVNKCAVIRNAHMYL